MSTEIETPNKSLEQYYYVHEPELICGVEVPSIVDDYVEDHPSLVDRFFTRYYYIKSGANPTPYKVLFHSNRVCLICLAPEHPALKEGISSINFDIGNINRSKNSVKGKGKKGGMVLQADSTLALLTTVTGKTYKIPSCVRSKLIEVNTNLVNNPSLFSTAKEGEDYLAIVLPKPEHCDEIKEGLLTQTQYEEKLATIDFMEQNTQLNESVEESTEQKNAEVTNVVDNKNVKQSIDNIKEKININEISKNAETIEAVS
ncbi:protein Abitram [Teleopsis dalmanni]|uniref:protein Abitram n=1 Tax=Teleopsis dalmanni TaxID=139649 RepID=UPI000D32A6BD|nr:protein Abitram [Teleopsis dalmanni]